MVAYLIVRLKVTDAEQFAKYRSAVPAVIESFGGRYLTRGSPIEVLEGQYGGERIVILEFPTTEALQKFWHSPEYAAVKALRAGAAEFDVWAQPGA